MPEYNEAVRVEAVNRFLQLDYNKAQEFQDIVNLAGELGGTPVALITLLDKDKNWIKVKSGIELPPAMPRETSFCQYAIQQDELTIIPDTLKDQRFDFNPLVQQPPGVRFYAGAPLVLKDGIRVGSLCLFDVKPNNISDIQQRTLSILARQVTFLMELELSYKLLEDHAKALEERNESLRSIAHMQSHDIRQPLTSIMGLVNMIKEDGYKADKERLLMIEEAANDMDSKIHAIVEETKVA